MHRDRDVAEPLLKGSSVSIHPDAEEIAQMHADADQIWVPSYARLIKVMLTCGLCTTASNMALVSNFNFRYSFVLQNLPLH